MSKYSMYNFIESPSVLNNTLAGMPTKTGCDQPHCVPFSAHPWYPLTHILAPIHLHVLLTIHTFIVITYVCINLYRLLRALLCIGACTSTEAAHCYTAWHTIPYVHNQCMLYFSYVYTLSFKCFLWHVHVVKGMYEACENAVLLDGEKSNVE